jgi:NAD(P)H-dependent FMN reductase
MSQNLESDPDIDAVFPFFPGTGTGMATNPKFAFLFGFAAMPSGMRDSPVFVLALRMAYPIGVTPAGGTMITVISGTNRPSSKTRTVAGLVHGLLEENGEETVLLDLAKLPAEIFADSAYASKPDSFASFQDAVLETDGVLTVVPEYNGSFPGVLKYFIDMLRFPESLYEKPAAFVGLSAGRWGGLRAVEQLEMVFQYRNAHLFGRRCFIPGINTALDEKGHFKDVETVDRLRKTALDFASFCKSLGRAGP